MTPKARIALQESIKHWERLVACKTLAQVEKEGYRCDSCALCDNYARIWTCRYECPVCNHTDRPQCRDTPYWNANYALKDLSPGRIPKYATKLMQAELDFLRSLL